MPNNIITGQLVNIAQLNVERIFPPNLARHVLISQTCLSVENLYPFILLFDSHSSIESLIDRQSRKEKKKKSRFFVTRCIYLESHEETRTLETRISEIFPDHGAPERRNSRKGQQREEKRDPILSRSNPRGECRECGV